MAQSITSPIANCNTGNYAAKLPARGAPTSGTRMATNVPNVLRAKPARQQKREGLCHNEQTHKRTNLADAEICN